MNSAIETTAGAFHDEFTGSGSTIYYVVREAIKAFSEQHVIPALKLAYARGHYCDQQPCPGCEAGKTLEEITGRPWTQEECE